MEILHVRRIKVIFGTRKVLYGGTFRVPGFYGEEMEGYCGMIGESERFGRDYVAEVFTIGETMVSFTPQEHAPLRYVTGYRPHIAGAESNVAIGLQKLGHSCAWMSRLGEDEFGRYIYNFVRGEGADVNSVVFDEEHPTGIMFKEVSQGETKVYYYRHQSAASMMKPEDLEESSLKDSRILHLTGITPVLSEDCRQTVERAMEIAEENHIKVSFDPNIRKKLWKDRDYSEMIREFCLRSDIVLLGLDEAEQLFPRKIRKKFSAASLKMGKRNMQRSRMAETAPG